MDIGRKNPFTPRGVCLFPHPFTLFLHNNSDELHKFSKKKASQSSVKQGPFAAHWS
jgi:hypothetical protein